ncbi:MAG: UDP-N-acetylmuramoyl-L-alanine--D-glutamate ligase [Alphaproteobacteria bacterium]|nr:MAG: UDP-N-acetylmuramoyl-L-alanine--D-glutamate ligase [Alphaproteobacteria bacterium]
MIIPRRYEGKQIAVYGLGRTGLSAIRSLVAGGASVVAWDDNEAAAEQASAAGALVMHPSGWNWLALTALVLSPGVPLTHPEPHDVVRMAKDANVDVIGDTELFAQALEDSGKDARLVVITGTNGKSTTTALTAHMISKCGLTVQMGGNIGIPVLDLAPPSDDMVYVLEMSSYQADLTHSMRTDVSILLNITPDHLERHGGYEGYITSKRRVLDMVKRDGRIVLGVNSIQTQAICTELKVRDNGRLLPVAVGEVLSYGYFVIGGVLWDGTHSVSDEVVDLKEVDALTGAHNWENAAAAYACGRALGLDPARLVEGLKSFPGLPHRQENLPELRGVRFVNDSKATNAEAAAKALVCYDNIYWIAGGRLKQGGVSDLVSLMGPVVRAYLIGEGAAEIAETLKGRVEMTQCGTLERALDRAMRDALSEGRPDPVILLSPACASFDQYPDFEKRGDAFKAAVAALKEGSQVPSNGDAVA